MKNYFMALCILLLAGCTEADVEETVGQPKINSQKFYAEFAEEDIRTFVDEKVRVLWTKGDLLTIFTSTLNKKYQFEGETGDISGTFSEIATSQSGTGNSISANYAVYPYSSSNKISNDEVLTLSLPATQRYAANSFGQDANTMVAVTSGLEDNFLPFRNVCGFLRLHLYGEGVTLKRIELKGNNNEKIAGSATVTAKYGQKPVVEMNDDAIETITLDCGDGVTLGATEAEAKDFWIVVPPTTFTNGFTVTITDTAGATMEKSTTKNHVVERNVFKSMAAFEVKTEGIPIPPDNEIWYITTDGCPISLNNAKTDWGYPETDYGENKIVSSIYTNGKGIIKFNKAVTKIGSYAFWRCENLQIMYLPSQINIIDDNAFNNCANLQHLYLFGNLHTAGIRIFDNCFKLESFESSQASKDKKTLIVNSAIVGFAPYDITEYTTQLGVKDISAGAFCNAYKLRSITLSEGVENIGPEAFEAQDPERDSFSAENNLEATIERVYLPSTLQSIHPYAFLFQNKIKGFYGQSEFISSDNKFIWQYDYIGRKELCSFASGSNLMEYSIPEGIQVIENYAFYKSNIESVTFPSTLCQCPSGYVFEHCHSLKSFSGNFASTDSKALIDSDGTIYVLACAGMSTYTTPEEVTAIGDGVFINKDNLEHITLSDNVKYIYGSNNFGYCDKLKTVTLSARLLHMGSHTFYPAPKLESVYCRAIYPPEYVTPKNEMGDISEYFDFNFYVPQGSIEYYKSSTKYAAFTNIKEFNFENLPQIDYYYSTDYSQDSKVTTLQTATKGDGIDIVLMGDAYSDRQIADGTYKKDMEYIYNNLFTEEPYKSFKDHFNVRYVNVVSATEGYEYGNTALGGYFGDGTLVGGDDNAVFNYALNAISDAEMDEALLIVAMNSDNYAGTCWMYYPTNATGTYGSGPSVAYFPRGGDETTFAQLLHHEACGHGFAKLADEYDYGTTVSAEEVATTKTQQSDWGWWKNVDFTSNPAEVRWSYFLSDSRYANNGLGVFEGGMTHSYGVWRPTENSIMRYNTGGFNAPSREAIYYRIHKLAYGDSWEYDYETFVEWDARNRAAAAVATRAAACKPANYRPTHPPVVVKKSWRDAK